MDLKIGVKIGPADGPDVRSAAAAAARVGFESVWLSEMLAGYSAARIDSLLATYAAAVSNGFLSDPDSARALIEGGAGQ